MVFTVVHSVHVQFMLLNVLYFVMLFRMTSPLFAIVKRKFVSPTLECFGVRYCTYLHIHT